MRRTPFVVIFEPLPQVTSESYVRLFLDEIPIVEDTRNTSKGLASQP